MGRPKKDNRTVTCSFSIHPEMKGKLAYVQMMYGLSAWINQMLDELSVDEVLSTQYATIKGIITKHKAYIRHLGMEDYHYTNGKYTCAVRGLGKLNNRTILLEVLPSREREYTIREKYDLINSAIEEIKGAGFDAQWL